MLETEGSPTFRRHDASPRHPAGRALVSSLRQGHPSPALTGWWRRRADREKSWQPFTSHNITIAGGRGMKGKVFRIGHMALPSSNVRAALAAPSSAP